MASGRPRGEMGLLVSRLLWEGPLCISGGGQTPRGVAARGDVSCNSQDPPSALVICPDSHYHEHSSEPCQACF